MFFDFFIIQFCHLNISTYPKCPLKVDDKFMEILRKIIRPKQLTESFRVKFDDSKYLKRFFYIKDISDSIFQDKYIFISADSILMQMRVLQLE
jgi:hypothetical protein